MFRLLRSSKVTFNIHIDVAKGYAGNIRMFEATGCGSLLLTEDAPNIRELFEPGREIVTYGSDAEAAEKIDHYVSKDREREAIAKAGQERTLARHTTGIRAEEFLSIVRAFGRRRP
jgi:spore maturation protein CgeB